MEVVVTAVVATGVADMVAVAASTGAEAAAFAAADSAVAMLVGLGAACDPDSVAEVVVHRWPCRARLVRPGACAGSVKLAGQA
jgi:hypothetical protein